jgi:hypothetical protein
MYFNLLTLLASFSYIIVVVHFLSGTLAHPVKVTHCSYNAHVIRFLVGASVAWNLTYVRVSIQRTIQWTMTFNYNCYGKK